MEALGGSSAETVTRRGEGVGVASTWVRLLWDGAATDDHQHAAPEDGVQPRRSSGWEWPGL
eukprot:1619168-Pyramimonas_sp.AAC.1